MIPSGSKNPAMIGLFTVYSHKIYADDPFENRISLFETETASEWSVNNPTQWASLTWRKQTFVLFDSPIHTFRSHKILILDSKKYFCFISEGYKLYSISRNGFFAFLELTSVSGSREGVRFGLLVKDTLYWPLYFVKESFLLVPVSLPHTLTDFVEWSNKYALQVVQYKLSYEHMLSSCARIKLKLSLIVMKLHFWLTSGEENLPCAENARANSQDMKDITHPYMFVRIFLALIGAITA